MHGRHDSLVDVRGLERMANLDYSHIQSHSFSGRVSIDHSQKKQRPRHFPVAKTFSK